MAAPQNAAPAGYEHPGARGHTVALKDIRKTLQRRVLSEADWRHWTTWGYVVVPNAVPAANLRRLRDLLWAFTGMDPNDPASWEKPQLRDHEMKELNNSGMAEIYHHQYLWDNRQCERVYDAFVDIWDREDLWVAIDRANFNPPNRGARAFEGFIHWDADTTRKPLPVGVQGVLSLVDTDAEMGGFQCVPELFRGLEAWIDRQPADRIPHRPDITGFEVVNVAMREGDLLIFNSLLAHGVRPNRSADRVRMAQYVSMFPADEADAAERAARIRSWQLREPPRRGAFPGDPRQWEKANAPLAALTPLGEKLLGLASWRS